VLNVASTRMYTILALIVNFKRNACKKWTSSLKLVAILVQCRYTETVQRTFKYSDIRYTILTLDKTLNSLVYRTLFYVNIQELQTCKKLSDFWPPCILNDVSLMSNQCALQQIEQISTAAYHATSVWEIDQLTDVVLCVHKTNNKVYDHLWKTKAYVCCIVNAGNASYNCFGSWQSLAVVVLVSVAD